MDKYKTIVMGIIGTASGIGGGYMALLANMMPLLQLLSVVAGLVVAVLTAIVLRQKYQNQAMECQVIKQQLNKQRQTEQECINKIIEQLNNHKK